MKTYSITIAGATGLVGSTLLRLLEERHFPIDHLYLLGSQQSAGNILSFQGKEHPVYDLASFDFTQSQIAFFCVGSDLASMYVPKAVSAGNIVMDKSVCYRYHPDVPLVVPEVNLHDLSRYHKMNIIANPNCNTVPIAVAIKPIYDAVGIKRINVATYQSVSGTGKEAVTELTEQTKQLLAKEGGPDQPISPRVYSQQIAFNVLPHIDDFQTNGYTKEEMKIVWELQKIFNDTSLAINPTAVRVPVYVGHAASVHLETHDKMTTEQAIALFAQASGLQLMTGEFPYPTPVKDAAGKDLVYVGRVREDISHARGLNFWVVTDNLRKGAALNAVQVVEHMIEHDLL